MTKTGTSSTGTEPRTPPFGTVLVANRGEIACRVIRTLRAMGIRSVAVYSDADAGARHVREADVAYRIGPAEAARSYLDADAVLDAARRSGAEAIHPGYGFLSENADFARACRTAGIVFIGPSPEAIEAMGDKVRAKRLVAQHGVPVTAGVDDRTLGDEALAAAAERLGMPVLVKPSAGGGGMGMVEVRETSELRNALATARRVARSAFGGDALFVERLIETPRHIEVQVLADDHGNVVHLGERECSLQRRHQKVIEEAPSPAVDAVLRERLGAAACEVARAVGYTGAGTVEFLVSDADRDSFSFMEMNTRLQVEHPVTELAATLHGARGVDLVEQQVRIAAGQALTFTQDDLGFSGHAVEARVYAEDPARGFLPATGRVLALADDDDVRAGRLDTGLIARMLDRVESVAAAEDASHGSGTQHVLALAALALHDDRWRRGSDAPWSRPTGWRLGDRAPARYAFGIGDVTAVVEVTGSPEAAQVIVDGARPLALRVIEREGDRMLAQLGSRALAVHLARDGDRVWVACEGASASLLVLPLVRSAVSRGVAGASGAAADPRLRSPMPGTVVSVEATDGEPVEAGAGILVIEAMKMEHRLTAPLAGTVRLRVRAGDRVAADEELAVIEIPLEHEAAGASHGSVVASASPDPVAPMPGDDGSVPTPDGTASAEALRPLPTMEGRS
jgi:acetyl-CoA/propionyl-CoA carboxylase biotin carboxyl carrier protein